MNKESKDVKVPVYVVLAMFFLLFWALGFGMGYIFGGL